MLKSNLGKLLLATSAAAGILLLFAQTPTSAASASYCAAHARTMASDRAPAGSSRFKRIYDTAYANCRGGSAGIMNPSYQTQALTAAPAPAPAAPSSGGACDFSKYHSSWDPTQCP
jgi:hypothetical protein